MIKLDISETELWNRFENGDVKAFSIIYEHHVDDMFRYGMKICGDKEVALDSIHDVFVKIFSMVRARRLRSDCTLISIRTEISS